MGSWRGLKHVHFSVEFTYVNSSCRLVQSTSILVIFILRRSDWVRRISESSTTDNQSVGFVTAVWKDNVKRRKFTVVHKWREFGASSITYSFVSHMVTSIWVAFQIDREKRCPICPQIYVNNRWPENSSKCVLHQVARSHSSLKETLYQNLSIEN